MKHTIACIAIATAMAGANAQDREGAAKEAADERMASECFSDPGCAAAVRNARIKDAEEQAAWEGKPLDQKLEPYFWLALAAGGLWLYLKKSKK